MADKMRPAFYFHARSPNQVRQQTFKSDYSLIAALVAALFTSGAQAATLGDIQLLSKLGQPLDAQIRVQLGDGEVLEQGCIAAQFRDGGEGGALHKLHVDYNLDKSGAGRILLLSDSAVDEPYVQVGLQLRCREGLELKRDYTVLLDPPLEAARQQAANDKPVIASAVGAATHIPNNASINYVSKPGDSLYALGHQRFPGELSARQQFLNAVRALNPDLPQTGNVSLPAGKVLKLPAANDSARVTGGSASQVTVVKGDTLNSLSQRLTKGNAKQQDGMVDTLRQLNPGLPADGDRALPEGLALRTPRGVSAKPSPAQIAANTNTTTQAVAKTGGAKGTAGDRLQISGAAPDSTKGKDAVSAEQEALKARERELLDQAAEQLASLHEAENRIDKLDKRLNWLANELSRREAAHKAEIVAIKSQGPDWTSLGFAAGAGGALAAGLAFLLSRFGRRQTAEGVETDRLAASLRESNEAAMWLDDDAASETTILRKPLVQMPSDIPSAAPHASDMDVFILNTAASEAAVLAAHGQYDRAITLLEDEIAAYPTSLVNWMQLFELLHGNRDTDHFIDLANRFKANFASEALWAKVRRMGVELAPDDALFAAAPSVAPVISTPLDLTLDDTESFNSVFDADLMFDVEEVAQPVVTPKADELSSDNAVAATPHRKEPMVQPLTFDLDRSITAQGQPEALNLISIPPLEAGTLDFNDPAYGEKEPANSLEQARRLIGNGEREAGAALLEFLMTQGTQEEKLAAADMLVRLTSPR